jgi:hypothetical protein
MSRFAIEFPSPPPPDAINFLERATRVPFAYLDMRDWFCCTARVRYGDEQYWPVVGVLLCEPRNHFDWHFSCAIADQRIMSKRLLKTIFKTLFTRAFRVTAMVEPTNEKAWRQLRRMGFVYEGYCRRGIEGTRDALVFGMLPEDCPFLPGYTGTGTIIRTDLTGAAHGL